jgi:DNA-binding LacI/PurR family transcriptional regulator
MLGVEPFFAELIAGIEEGLAGEERSLLLHVVPDQHTELAAYKRWAGGSMVDAVIVVNLVVDDPRPQVLLELGIPAVALGGKPSGMPLSNVWIDDGRAMRDAVGYLAGLGHTRLGRVSGPHELDHTRARTVAFDSECGRLDLAHATVEGDYTEESGRAATLSLLSREEPPSAVVYDNDIMAIAGLSVAAESGVSVPARLSLLAWDDSTLCRLSNPALSAMTLDVYAMGSQVAHAVLNMLAGGPITAYMAPLPRLSARASTAPPER